MESQIYQLETFLELPVVRLAYKVSLGLLLISLCSLLFNGFTCQLQHLPGPQYTRFTSLVLKWFVLTGNRMYYIHSLHETYGTAVRVSPWEASFADVESFQAIHKITGGFLKSPWYQSFRDQPAKDLFTFVDPKGYAQRRKLMARPFSYSELKANWESTIREKTEATCQKIKEDAVKGTADIYKWWTLMAYDIVTLIAFGEQAGLIKTGEKSRDILDLEKVTSVGGIRSETRFFFDLITSLPIPSFRKLQQVARRVRDQGWKAVENAKKQDLAHANIFSGIIEQAGAESGLLREIDAVVEAQGLIIAGSGTTAVTLTYLVWAVLQRPALRELLTAECQTLPENFDDTHLEKLEVLNGVINETLRLYGAAPGSLPRTVPSPGVELGGYHIPAGLTVCTQAYTIHRNPTLFPDVESFDHTRWSAEGSKVNQTSISHPFGAGARKCIGLHLAGMELRYAAAFYFRECSTFNLAPSVTSESMKMLNFFLIAPASHSCEITGVQKAQS